MLSTQQYSAKCMSEVATPFSRLKTINVVIYYQITLFCDWGIGVLLDNMLSVYIYQFSNKYVSR